MPRSLALLLLLAPAPLFAQAAAPDTAGVRAAVEHYLQGHATGEGRHFQMVFHPVSMLFFTDNGQFRSRTGVEYIAGAPGKPADDEAQRKRRIVFVDADGDAGVAKVELDYPQVRFADYFTLLKIDGQWRIMNKIFSRHPKQSQ
jgi:Putative lumazine-binding